MTRIFGFVTAIVSAACSWGAPCPSGYGWYQSITIVAAKVSSGPYNHLPLLLPLSNSNLATVANGGKVQNSNGYDIIVSDTSGNKLNFELVGHSTQTTYVATTGAAEIWFDPGTGVDNGSVFNLCFGNASISTYQGNDTTVWSNGNYVFVVHAPNGTTLSMADSGPNSIGVSSNTGTVTSGEIDGGVAYASASSQYTDYGTPSATRLTTITTSFWVKNSDTGNRAPFSNEYSAGSSQGFAYAWNTAGAGKIRMFWAPGSVNVDSNSIASLNDGNWHYFAGEATSTTPSFYWDGSSVGVSSGSPGSSLVYGTTNHLYTGRYTPGNYFNGSMDEIRVNSTTLSTGWLTTEFNNQSNPATFWTVGTLTSIGGIRHRVF